MSHSSNEKNPNLEDSLKISMVIGSFNRCNLLKLCIDSIRSELKDLSYEIIVVDGGSTDGTVEWLTLQKDIILILQHNRGQWLGKQIKKRPWAYFMNLGFKSAQGKYICMLSDDSLIIPGCILNGLSCFEASWEKGDNPGAVAFYFRDYPVRKDYAVAINVGNLYVNHGLYLRGAMHDVGYCDENYSFYFADTDLALKIQEKGYKILACENSFVEHYFDATPEIRASNNDDKKEKDRLRLIKKWAGRVFPLDKQDDYLKLVGYWHKHPNGFTDVSNTIQKLIDASIPKTDVNINPPIISPAQDPRYITNPPKALAVSPTSSVKYNITMPQDTPFDNKKCLDYLDELIGPTDWSQILYADHFYISQLSAEDKKKCVERWLKKLNQFHICIDDDINVDFLFFRSLVRPDYKQLFHAYIDSCQRSKYIVEDYEGTANTKYYFNSSTELLLNASRKLRPLNFESKYCRMYCIVKLALYLKIIISLSKIKFKTIVLFADMQPVEHLASLYFGRLGFTTVTTQHGLYIDYNGYVTVNAINYLHHPSNHFLAWGENTKELISKYHPNANIVICGKPSSYDLEKPRNSQSGEPSLVLIMDQKPLNKYNLEIADILTRFAKINEVTLLVRFHPSNNKKIFIERFPLFQEVNSFSKACLVVGHTSSLLYEAMYVGYKIARYESNMPSIDIGSAGSFSNIDKLNSIYSEPFIDYEVPISSMLAYSPDDSKKIIRRFFEELNK